MLFYRNTHPDHSRTLFFQKAAYFFASMNRFDLFSWQTRFVVTDPTSDHMQAKVRGLALRCMVCGGESVGSVIVR